MISSVSTVIAGVVFGLALAAPPGPMNAIIAEESVFRGWLAGFSAGLGAMAADVLFFLLALGGAVTIIDRYPAVRPALYVAGGLLMCYFAVGAISRARSTDDGRSPNGTVSRGFSKTFTLSLTNPYQLGFWLTVGVGLLDPGTLDVVAHLPAGHLVADELIVRTGSAALLVGFFAGIALWIVLYPAALVAAGRRVETLTPIVAVLSGAVLAVFGVVFLALGIGLA